LASATADAAATLETTETPAPRRLSRRRLVLIAVGAVIVAAGTTAGLMLTLSSGPVNAKSIISGDGYTSIAMDHAQTASLVGSGAAPYIGNDAAMELNGQKVGIVVQLSPSGKDKVPALLPLAQGEAASSGVQIKMNGDYLVFSGALSAISHLGS
jgi:hypothetical protein